MKQIKELFDKILSGEVSLAEYTEPEKEKLIAKLLHDLPLESIVRIKQKLKNTKENILSHRVIGKIVHIDSKIPIPNLQIELYGQDPLGLKDYLGSGETDKNGDFEIYYDPKAAGFGDASHLQLRVYDPVKTISLNGEVHQKKNLIEIINGDNNVTQKEYDFRVQEILYYEYDPNYSIFPYSCKHSLKHNFVPKALEITEGSVAKFMVPMKEIIQINMLDFNKPSYEEIQDKFPADILTINLEKEQKGYTRSDEFFGERMLNGLNPIIFKKDKDNSSLYTTSFNGEKFELTGKIDLPNYKVKFKLEKEKLLPVEITLQFREDNCTQPNPPMKKPQTYTPADGNQWLQAKRVIRATHLGVLGDVKWHLSLCHFNMEQYALSFFRNIRKNPVRNFLYPHIKEVVHINDFGREILMNPKEGFFAELEPMLVQSSLPQADMLSWIRSNLGSYDWTDWQPRKPLCKSHNYAKLANLYWDILTTHTTEYFAANHDKIVENWDEILRFSDELVKHSVPYESLTLEQVDDSDQQVDDSDQWYDFGEIGDCSPNGRVTIDGELKAIRPITTSAIPSEQDIANLKQVCKYIIYICTFPHTWIHLKHNDEFGEIKYGILLSNGSMGDEDDERVLPGQKVAAIVLAVNNMLTNFKYGYMLKNEDGDVPSRLIDLLTSKSAEFEKLGFPLDELRSRLNS